MTIKQPTQAPQAPELEWQRIQHARNGDTYAARFGVGWLVRFREVIPSDNDALTSSMVYVPDSVAFPDVVFGGQYTHDGRDAKEGESTR